MAQWGVEVAQRLGLFEPLAQAGGAIPTWAVNYDELIPPDVAEEHRIDLSSLVPGVPGTLCLHHPVASETLTQLAASSGTEVVRGVEDIMVNSGPRPSVSYRVDRSETTIQCRLVVGADGRNSTVRQQTGIPMHRAELTNVVAGLLVEGATEWPQDTLALGVEGDRMFLAFPQGGDRVRLYLAIAPDQRDRFAGPEGTARFLNTFELRSMPGGAVLAAAKPIGPCATLGGEDTWTDEPYDEGVVLIGDAAGYNGPIIGQGLSIALRDVELVSQALLGETDWSSPAIFQAYGADRAERMRRVRFMADLHAALFCSFSPEAVQRRGGFFGRLASGQDPRLQWVVGAPLVGPYNLPPQAFEESFRREVLATDPGAA
jgi:2-polyprenyl-6-methoxyphenol hydroxylase-like FAD-dependent oxidoreductase